MDGGEVNSIIVEADPALVRFRDESRFWIQRVLLPIIGTIGVFGNIATILVLTRRGMRTSTNVYLTALAVADLIYLVCVLWLSLRHYPYVNESVVWSYIYSHVWPYCVWLADATTNTSVWLTVTFTVERYIAIAYPIKGRVLCTVSRAKKVILSVYLICFMTTITTPFEWTVEVKTDPITNISKHEIASSILGKEKIYRTVYYWFTTIIFVLLPLTLLIIFNSFLIHSFRQSQKLSRIMTARHKISEREERAATREIKITGTLITVVIMFLVCQLPTAATLIYQIFHVAKLNPNEEAVLRALGNIFNCLVSFNMACNFLLYCALSDKYRRTFLMTFCGCFYKPSITVRSRAFFTHQVEGRNGVQYASHRRQSSFSTRSNPTVVPLSITTTLSSQKVSSKQHRRPSFPGHRTCTKMNCYVITLPAISENYEPSNSFSTSNPSQAIVSIQHHYPSPGTGPRNKITKKRFSLDSFTPEISNRPIIWPRSQSHSIISIPIEIESRIHIIQVSNAKEIIVTSSSV